MVVKFHNQVWSIYTLQEIIIVALFPIAKKLSCLKYTEDANNRKLYCKLMEWYKYFLNVCLHSLK